MSPDMLTKGGDAGLSTGSDSEGVGRPEKPDDEKSEKENKNININRSVKGMKGFGGYLLNEGFSIAEELRNQRCRDNQRNNDRNKSRKYLIWPTQR